MASNSNALWLPVNWSPFSWFRIDQARTRQALQGSVSKAIPSHGRLKNHQYLPWLVKQHYGTESWFRTLASIKHEISLAIDSLLAELKSDDETKALHTSLSHGPNSNTDSNKPILTLWQKTAHCARPQTGGTTIFFVIVLTYQSAINALWSVPDRFFKFFCINVEPDQFLWEPIYPPSSSHTLSLITSQEGVPSVSHILVCQSLYLDTFLTHKTVRVVLDSGATGNMIHKSAGTRLGIPITPNSQSANQADGWSPLVDETHFVLTRYHLSFEFEGLVVEELDVEVIGEPFF